MKRFLALATMLITFLTAGTAFASRVTTHSYINTPVSTVAGPTCSTPNEMPDPALDGACFVLQPGETSLDAQIYDDHNSSVFGRYNFTIHIKDQTGEFYVPTPNMPFCGSTSAISIPENAVTFAVSLAANGALTNCGGVGHIATTGTISVTIS